MIRTKKRCACGCGEIPKAQIHNGKVWGYLKYADGHKPRTTPAMLAALDRGRKANWANPKYRAKMCKVSSRTMRRTNLQHPEIYSRNLIHGHNRKGQTSKTYRSWAAMLGRCYNKRNHAFEDYGGRGIKVTLRWLDFRNFLADMGEAPKGKSIDRFPDNNGNYEPRNCRWATPKEQANNRRPARRTRWSQ